MLDCVKVPKSSKLLQLTLEVGDETRTVVSGIAKSYEPEYLIGKTVVIVKNLKPAKLMGIESRGMVLCNSAGNEGDGRWKKIGFPADAHDILAVGAVDDSGANTVFSSIGYSADHRVKPDVMARGAAAALLHTDGTVTTSKLIKR